MLVCVAVELPVTDPVLLKVDAGVPVSEPLSVTVMLLLPVPV